MRTRTTLSITAVLSLAVVTNALPRHKDKHHGQHGSYYPGWAGIDYIFSFGDSYTTTGFNTSLTQPSPSNPLGNPTYPGYTSSNGPNWIDYLTTTYNTSLIQTVNLAYGGATVDSNLVTPYLPTVLSVLDQINTEYLPLYSKPSPQLPWNPHNTLFSLFIGINDIGNSYQAGNVSLATIFERMAGVLDTLYHTGARNFLLLNVPPVNLSPLTTSQGLANATSEARSIADWNARLGRLSQNLTGTYTDATAFVFDTNALFDKVLEDPCAYRQTCAYKNTTDYCVDYQSGTAEWDTFLPECGIRVDEYFWLNSLHPTFRVHDVMAELIAEELK